MKRTRIPGASLGLALALCAGMAAAGEGRLAAIAGSGVLKVCIQPDNVTVTYRDPLSGQLSGIDITLAAALAGDLGVRAEYIDASAASLADDLEAGRCDIAMSGLARVPDRMPRVRFSMPYLQNHLQAVTTRGKAAIGGWDDLDRPGRVIAVRQDSNAEAVAPRLLQNARLMVVRPPRTREQEVLAGRADAFVTDFPEADRVRRYVDWARVIPAAARTAPLSYAYAVAPGDEPWLQRINAFVAAIRRDGRLASVAGRFRLKPMVIAE